jgi:hypothetical protein
VRCATPRPSAPARATRSTTRSTTAIMPRFSLSRGCVEMACPGVVVALISRLNVSRGG